MHVRRALALAVAGPLILAGCTGDPEPTPKIPDPTTSTSTPSPTDSETAESESAEEFIRRWAAVEAEMENTGETAEYRELSPDCKACIGLADDVERIYADGGYLKWDGWDIKRITQQRFEDSQFVVKVVSSPTEYVERAGGRVQTLEGGPGAHLLTLEQQDDDWLVVDKGAVSQ